MFTEQILKGFFLLFWSTARLLKNIFLLLNVKIKLFGFSVLFVCPVLLIIGSVWMRQKLKTLSLWPLRTHQPHCVPNFNAGTKGCRSSHWRSLHETKHRHLPTHNTKRIDTKGLIAQTSIAMSTEPVAWQLVERPEVHWQGTIVLVSVCWVLFYGWPNSPNCSYSTLKTWNVFSHDFSFNCSVSQQK